MSVLDDVDDEAANDEREALATRLAVAEAENERLRQEYARARQTTYRRTAIGLGLVGVLGVLGAFLVPSSRTVLFALGGTGLFAGLLTFYLTPERFIAASVGQEVYAALAANESTIVRELGLADERIYVPSTGGESNVYLYIPQDAADAIPSVEALKSVFVVEEGVRGLSFQTTGNTLFTEFEQALTDDLSREPPELAAQLADGLVEQFELVQRADADAGDERITVAVEGSAYGSVDRFDHPVPSFIAAGIARAIEMPVHVNVHAGDEERSDHLVTCTWTAVTPNSESGEDSDDEGGS